MDFSNKLNEFSARVLKLKENIKWQNNSDFTAEDVKFTIEEIQKNKKSYFGAAKIE